jgi:hypothetical protein
MKLLYSMFEIGTHYIGYVILALTGGLVNHLEKLRSGEIKKFRLLPLLIDLSSSGFAGLLVALLASNYDMKQELIFFLAGISGHFGARSIFLIKAIIEARVKAATKNKDTK